MEQISEGTPESNGADGPWPCRSWERSESPPSRGNRQSTLAGRRAVLCEDEAVTQMQLRHALRRAGIDVVGSATNGREAVEITLQERPDLVVMDIRMPLMDGLSAARQILSEFPVCVVMLTAFSHETYVDQAREIGVSGYVVKPVTGDLLIPHLERAYEAFTRGEPIATDGWRSNVTNP